MVSQVSMQARYYGTDAADAPGTDMLNQLLPQRATTFGAGALSGNGKRNTSGDSVVKATWVGGGSGQGRVVSGDALRRLLNRFGSVLSVRSIKEAGGGFGTAFVKFATPAAAASALAAGAASPIVVDGVPLQLSRRW